MYIDSNLIWSHQTEILSATGMLAKVRYYITKNTLHMIYFRIFSSTLRIALKK